MFNVVNKTKPNLLPVMAGHYKTQFACNNNLQNNKEKLQEYAQVLSHDISQITTEWKKIHIFEGIPVSLELDLFAKDEQAFSTITDAIAQNMHQANPDLVQATLEKDRAKVAQFTQSVVSNFSNIPNESINVVLYKNHKLADLLIPKIRENIKKLDSNLALNLLYYSNNEQAINNLINENIVEINPGTLRTFLRCARFNFISRLVFGKNLKINLENKLDKISPTALGEALAEVSYFDRLKLLNNIHQLHSNNAYEVAGNYNLFDNKPTAQEIALLYNKYKPWFYTTIKAPDILEFSGLTQSEGHIATNKPVIKSTFHVALSDEKVVHFVKRIHEQEKQEQTAGRVTFVHGCKWEWDIRRDLFTRLWQLVDKKNFNNYKFLRFEASYNETPEDNKVREQLLKDGRTNALRPKLFFMNHALFGNTNNEFSCTFKYWYDDHDFSSIKISLKDLFSQLNLTSLYDQHKNEVEELEKLHKKAGNKGSILLISTTPEFAEKTIFPAHIMGYKKEVIIDGKKATVPEIAQTLKTKPHLLGKEADELEYCMALTNDYALNPDKAGKDIKIYPFHMAQDTPEYKLYTKKRDQLFKKIERELAAQNATPDLMQKFLEVAA